MEVRLVPEAREELRGLDPKERAALVSALKKLEAGGPVLGAPHTSQGEEHLPQGTPPPKGQEPVEGDLPARRRRDGRPEAKVDRRGFDRAVRRAQERIARIEEEGKG